MFECPFYLSMCTFSYVTVIAFIFVLTLQKTRHEMIDLKEMIF